MATVFLPGTLCDERVFAPQVSALEVTHEACAVLPLRVGTTVSDCARWVLTQAPARFNLVGFSQGAVVAFELMRQAPERISRLVLIAANPTSSSNSQKATWQRWRERVYQGRFDEVVQDLCQGLYYPHQDVCCDVLLAMAHNLGEAVLLQQLAMLESRIDSTTTLAHITCPVQLIVGQHDRITPVTVHEHMLHHLPHASLSKIAVSGHYVSLEQPTQVSQVLLSFLNHATPA
jgi:pimeloyl-ACP methyl ester carboxylesterase